jgi:hypothetical protein
MLKMESQLQNNKKNEKALIREDFDSNPPAGYEFEDGPLYIWAIEVTDKASLIFRK